jgi:16S rRNA (adenine1518-N6/adenine1519-N6)-dimethyltransferase
MFAKTVTAVEIDKSMCNVLRTELSHMDNLTVVNQDFLKYTPPDLPEGKSYTVVANLPYYITAPILFRLFEMDCAGITIMLQKEVGDRILAQAGTKDYGALTLTVARYATAELIARVPPNSFVPRPDVHSAVLKLTPIPHEKDELLDKVIRTGFLHRRKTLLNNLTKSELGLNRERCEVIIQDLGLDPAVRGEVLDLAQYKALTHKIKETM